MHIFYTILSFFVLDVFASAPAQQHGFDFRSLMPFVLIFVVFYFLLIRPQQKREAERKSMLDSLKKGDTVITSGGLVAKVSNMLPDGEVELEISNGVNVKFLKSCIVDIPSGRPKPKPSKNEKSIAEIKSELKAAAKKKSLDVTKDARSIDANKTEDNDQKEQDEGEGSNQEAKSAK